MRIHSVSIQPVGTRTAFVGIRSWRNGGKNANAVLLLRSRTAPLVTLFQKYVFVISTATIYTYNVITK